MVQKDVQDDKYFSECIESGLITCPQQYPKAENTTFEKWYRLIGVIGASESEVTSTVANFLKVFTVPQITPLAGAPDLGSKTVNDNLLRTSPSDKDTIEALMHFLM
ncbi:unnamed protein product [Protopolystoma xenopodis]|uniref:Receptor ligand binding region domain-containing protein n=1 Tax=Protopolystoma xenopodis TaxID=117903 RepID=A0A448XPQ6_9PLAT|nr:unnamed protein product [Protopolystoma xenopodis]